MHRQNPILQCLSACFTSLVERGAAIVVVLEGLLWVGGYFQIPLGIWRTLFADILFSLLNPCLLPFSLILFILQLIRLLHSKYFTLKLHSLVLNLSQPFILCLYYFKRPPLLLKSDLFDYLHFTELFLLDLHSNWAEYSFTGTSWRSGFL